MAEEVTLRVTALDQRGEGVAAQGGARIAVAGALPGETVRGVVSGGRMDDPRIERPAPGRVAPACRHFGSCGGCVLQHASDRLGAKWKAGMVLRALGARGLAPRLASVIVSPPHGRRRAAFAALATPAGVVLGFHGRRSHEVVAVPGCRVLAPAIVDAMPALARLAALGLTRSGARGRMVVTLTGGGIDAAAEAMAPLSPAATEAAVAIAAGAGLARLSWNGVPLAQFRPPEIGFGRARVIPPPGGFLQATASGEAALLGAVRAGLGDAARIADLFAGCGTFALPLAEAAEVHAAESDGAAVAALLAGWRQAQGLRRLSAERRDLFRRPLLPAELDRFDAAVIDPPRAGAEAQARAIAAARLGRLVMVSCNPATFARDAAILVGAGFEMGPVTVVDQFRWSPHVEMAAPFLRR
ncbi:MAG: class I SAM-dependent RNA methyltransferase [Alphaproteobacteria bacterium]|nr:MAG: class I SAM-dependent RNA methyltransferase [Alphaproteobacteria bacterium]